MKELTEAEAVQKVNAILLKVPNVEQRREVLRKMAVVYDMRVSDRLATRDHAIKEIGW